MPLANRRVATAFNDIADLLEVQGANAFRIRAYRNAARTLEELGTDVGTFVSAGRHLTDLPGIGEDLAGKIDEILGTGSCVLLERLRGEVPPAVTELLGVPGLGPKRVSTLWHDLGVRTVDELHAAAAAGRVRRIHGFGRKTEQRILEATATQDARERRLPLDVADDRAGTLVAFLSEQPGVTGVDLAGSLRRRRETVGDLDIVVTAGDGEAVMRAFTQHPDVTSVTSSGPTRGTVLLDHGLQVDLRVVPEESRGAALQYFTGSKAHNIRLRGIAQSRGLKLNEYGLFRGDSRVAGATEESLYAALGLQWVPPELREDRGEIEAAAARRLPRLVTAADLAGDLHVHTRASDGHDTITAMAEAAKARGLRYLAITDHARRRGGAGSLDPGQLAEQIEEIRQANTRLHGITLLSGAEVEVLDDGSLDLPDEILGSLDLVVASVHTHFDLPRARQTARILRALDNPHVRVLGHPSARLIGERAPMDVDLPRIIRHARDRDVAIELNGQPHRLDITDRDCETVRAEGALVSIASDAHRAGDFRNLDYGVGQARRGWLEPKDVLNTRSVSALRKWLARH